MKTPFANFFKRIINKKITLDQKNNKPEDQVRAEKRIVEPPKKGHPVPYAFNDAQAKIRRKRNIRARIQKQSRITNR